MTEVAKAQRHLPLCLLISWKKRHTFFLQIPLNYGAEQPLTLFWPGSGTQALLGETPYFPAQPSSPRSLWPSQCHPRVEMPWGLLQRLWQGEHKWAYRAFSWLYSFHGVFVALEKPNQSKQTNQKQLIFLFHFRPRILLKYHWGERGLGFAFSCGHRVQTHSYWHKRIMLGCTVLLFH